MSANFLAALAVLAALFAQQPPAPSASVEGVVLRVGTDDAVPNALVTLTPITPKGPSDREVRAMTDAQGRFLVTELRPGAYRMDLAAEGYARMRYGARAPTGLAGINHDLDSGTPLALSAGDTLRGLVVRLTPTASVAGHVRNARGHGAVNLPVLLLRPIYSASGERTFVTVATAQTNDTGEYRLYWITPGRYFLAAGYIDKNSDIERVGVWSPPALGSEPPFPLRFFPGASEIGDARAIDLQPAQGLDGIDMTVDAQMLHNVSGSAVDLATGLPPFYTPPSNTPVLRTVSSSQSVIDAYYVVAGSVTHMNSISESYSSSDGSFEFPGLPPGTYLVQLAAPSHPIRVTVTDSNVEGVLIEMAPTVPISVKLSVEGYPAPPAGLKNWNFHLDVDAASASIGQVATRRWLDTAEEMEFLLNAPPGEYRLVGKSKPAGMYVKSIQYKGADALNQPIGVSGGDTRPELSIVFSTKVGVIEGVIVNASKKPVAGATAVLVPRRGLARKDLYRTATADESGRFVFKDVPPEDYRLYSWESIEPYSWFDLDVIAPYEDQSVGVHVQELSRVVVELKVIPVP